MASVHTLIKSLDDPRHKILIGTPSMGTVRIEWHNAINSLVIPVNWSNSMHTPVGFMVDDAQNLIVKEALDKNFEWVLLIEDDNVVPSDLLLKINRHMEKKKYPIISALYYLKSTYPEPFIFRGRGNGTYKKFKKGELVACDGVPTGCLLIHCSILRELAKVSDDYQLRANQQVITLKKIFTTPRMVFTDVALSTYQKLVGTSDLWFCDRILKEGILEKAGWKKLDKKYPFVVDTSITCGHIDRQTGQIYGN